MKKLALLLIIPFTLFLGIQMASAQGKATAPASTHTRMKASPNRGTAAAKANWDSYKPETLNGTISLIQAGKKTVYVTATNGVSFQFLVTRRTKIRINGTRSSLANLAEQANQHATVTFVARAKGDMARSITVSS